MNNPFELPTDFYSSNEIQKMHTELLNGPKWYEEDEAFLVAYKLYVPKGYTGKCMVLATSNIEDTCNSINSIWKDTKITAQIGDFSMKVNTTKIRAVYEVLKCNRYETKFKDVLGSDKVFSWSPWMSEMLKEL